MTSNKWFELYNTMMQFENNDATLSTTQYVEFITKNVDYPVSVCMACPGSMKKAHCDFQKYLFRKAYELNLDVLPEAPKLNLGYNSEFWAKTISLSDFHVLNQLVAKMNTEYAAAIKSKSYVDEHKDNFELMKQYIKVKKSIVKKSKSKKNVKIKETNDQDLLQESIEGDYRGVQGDEKEYTGE